MVSIVKTHEEFWQTEESEKNVTCALLFKSEV